MNNLTKTKLNPRKGLNIKSTIDKWFPLKDGYQKSDKITIKMLLSNTSGIRRQMKESMIYYQSNLRLSHPRSEWIMVMVIILKDM